MFDNGNIQILEEVVQQNEPFVSRIRNQVLGSIIVTREGIPVQSSFDNTATGSYTSVVLMLTEKSRSAVRDIDPTDDLAFLRIRTKKNEILVGPEKEFVIIVVQS